MTKLRGGVSEDAGFTLIELLIVMVILPVIIGAIAGVIILTLRDTTTPSNNLSDSVNAQLTAANFVRDVQTAAFITTNQSLYSSGVYGVTSPQVCGPTSSPGRLLVALYRAANTSDGATAYPSLDVGYWLQGSGGSTKIDRYACSLATPAYTAAPMSDVVVDSGAPGSELGPSAAAISATTNISPAQFASAASGQWAPAASFATTSATTKLHTASDPACTPNCAQPLPVSSINAFTTSNPVVITVAATSGDEVVDCSGVDTTVPEFTSCILPSSDGITSATVPIGALITQSNVSGVQISVTEPASSYKYNLVGSPASSAFSVTLPGTGPTMLALGQSGLGLSGVGSNTCGIDSGKKDKVCVNGGIVVDGGVVSCGSGQVYASGGIQTAGSGSCNGVTVPVTSPVPDPYTGLLPGIGCFTTSSSVNTTFYGNYATSAAGLDAAGNERPGIYTGTLSGTLEPGVYVIEGGLGTVSMAANSPSDNYFKEDGSGTYDQYAGVLIYFPGPAGSYPSGSQCVMEPSSTTYGIRDVNVSVAPLDSKQASYYFNDTALAGMWGWQDATNPSDIYFSGSSNICAGNAYAGADAAYSSDCGSKSMNGLAADLYGIGYFPAANITGKGTPGFYMGLLYIAGYDPGSGTPAVDLTGQLTAPGS